MIKIKQPSLNSMTPKMLTLHFSNSATVSHNNKKYKNTRKVVVSGRVWINKWHSNYLERLLTWNNNINLVYLQFKDHVEHPFAAVRFQELDNVWVLEHMTDCGFAFQVCGWKKNCTRPCYMVTRIQGSNKSRTRRTTCYGCAMINWQWLPDRWIYQLYMGNK